MTGQMIATFNTGSSSLKFSVFELKAGHLGQRRVSGALRDLHKDATLEIKGLTPPSETAIRIALKDVSPLPRDVIPVLLKGLLTPTDAAQVMAVGHRIVHGGRRAGPEQVSPKLLNDLSDLSCFAPDHQAHNLAGVIAVAETFPSLPQSLSFDTAFHRTQPRETELYALPLRYADQGLVRYGFHGLSYAHISASLPKALEGHSHARIIALHLGSGASLCAMKDGKSIATSMGLTAVSGIPMATRSGDLDPGLILHLIRDQDLSISDVADLIHHEAGLLGMSGESGDIRDLLASTTDAAQLAINVYVHRIVREIGSLMAALGGLDALVFTGGVGENAATIRARVCKGMAWAGLQLAASLNDRGAPIITAAGSKICAVVVTADEEKIIAQETMDTCLLR